MAQRPDEAKRREILTVAARLFARRPFHEVKLDEVAAEAGVGKGTLYCYFTSKEDLYFSIVESGFQSVVDEIRVALSQSHDSAWEQLSGIVRQLVAFGGANPDITQIMRTASQSLEPRIRPIRAELSELIRAVIEHGVAAGELIDRQPALTAQYIPAFIRAARLYGPRDLPDEALADHFLHILGRGLRSRQP